MPFFNGKSCGKSREKCRGFTLIELQISLLLVAIITVVLVVALRLSTDTWSKVEAREDLGQHSFLVVQFLRRHLDGMRFNRVLTSDSQRITSFLGDEHQLHFLAPFPGFGGDGELYWWSLFSRWNDELDIYQLVLSYLPFIPEVPITIEADGSISLDEDALSLSENEKKSDLEKQTATELVIADNFSIEEIEYYRREREGDESWEPEWEASLLIPQAVRLVLKDHQRHEGDQDLPDLVVSPRFARLDLFAEDK